jgi:putative hemolysin
MGSQLIVLLFMFIFSAFFSATETAFTSLSIVQAESLASKGGRRGKLVKSLAMKSDILLTTILIGNNLVNIIATALATQLTTEFFGSQYLGIMTGIMTLLILIFAEVTPKRLAIVYNETLCLLSADIVQMLSFVFRPVIWFIDFASIIITSLFGKKTRGHISLEGILHMVKLAEDQGLVMQNEKEVVRKALRFSDIPIQAIMTHRTRVFSLPSNLTVAQSLEAIRDEGFSRIPVFESDQESIVGVVFTRQLLEAQLQGRGEESLKRFLNEPFFVSTTWKINDLFQDFRSRKFNLAIVLDEYGGLAGIVTREDVVEELVGELYDEDEEIEVAKIQNLKNDRFRVAGDTPVHQFEDHFNTSIAHDKNIQTIAGYINDVTGYIPKKNEVIPIPGWEVRVENATENRILWMIFKRN